MRNFRVVFVCFMMVLLTAYLAGAFNGLFPDGWKDHMSFWRDVVTSLAGAFVGFRLALFAEHLKKQADDEERRINLYKALVAIFGRNKGHLAIMANFFQAPNGAPSFLCDVVSLDALIPLRCELLADCGTRELIDHAHFELSHVNRRVELTFLNPGDSILEGTRTLIATTEVACQRAIDAIKSRLIVTQKHLH